MTPGQRLTLLRAFTSNCLLYLTVNNLVNYIQIWCACGAEETEFRQRNLSFKAPSWHDWFGTLTGDLDTKEPETRDGHAGIPHSVMLCAVMMSVMDACVKSGRNQSQYALLVSS